MVILWNLPEWPPLVSDHLTKILIGSSISKIAISETSSKQPPPLTWGLREVNSFSRKCNAVEWKCYFTSGKCVLCKHDIKYENITHNTTIIIIKRIIFLLYFSPGFIIFQKLFDNGWCSWRWEFFNMQVLQSIMHPCQWFVRSLPEMSATLAAQSITPLYYNWRVFWEGYISDSWSKLKGIVH